LRVQITITGSLALGDLHLATVHVSESGSVVMLSPGLKTITAGDPIDNTKPLWRQIERLAARLAAIEEIAG
jgi:hypothetical protein